jgi:lipid II:glycine glycyltransferase (peptidoglycan interpeptide bridge formation enzyme)
VRAREATEAEVARWDELVVATGRPHLLQTAGWAALKASAGWRPLRLVLGDGAVAQVLLRPLPLGLTLAYLPRGPLVADAELVDAIPALRDALRRERCVSLLCDPEVAAGALSPDAIRSTGAAISPIHVQPRRTLLLDLAKEPEALLAEMHRKTRQYVHKAERDGVVTEETDDVGRFHALLQVVARRDGFGIHERAYFERIRDLFGDRAHFQMARVGDDDAGALLVVRVGDRAWELFGGWSGTHTEERPFYLLKWRSLVRMRQLGVTRYDMWGLSEGDAALSGVERFKLGFGGEQATWVGAIETPVTRALFPLWVLAGRRRLARTA